MSLGKRIRDIRLKRGYTQEFIAKKLGMGRSNFGHIENDRVTPSSEAVQKIADILNVTTDYLYGYVDEDIGVSSMKRTVGIDLKETAIYIVQDGRITKVSPKQYGTDEIIWRDGRVIDVVRSHRERLNGQEVI